MIKTFNFALVTLKMKLYYTAFLLLFCHNFLKADITELSYNGEGYLFPYLKNCSDILEEFAQSASNFTMCSIKFARPIRLCERCINHYMRFHNTSQELLNTSCRSLFVSHDRLDAVLEYYNSIQAIWNKGNCYACYDWFGNAPELSNNTKQFNKMFNNTLQCIAQNVNPNTNSSEEVCEKCMQSYIQLDEYYKTLSTDSIGVDSICMDIVDSMNATRSIWSKDLNCCKLRRSPEIVFLCCTGIISVLPLLFYLATRFCGPIRDLPNVLKQTRFKQTILRSGNGRIN